MSRSRSTLGRRPSPVNGPPVSADAAPRSRRGRRPAAELGAIRARVEVLMLQGLRSPAIHRALTGPDSPSPIAVSERGVRGHMRAVERAWLERASGDALEADRARETAQLEEMIRVALSRSTLHAGTNVGVGYFNASIKAHERYAKLRGLDAPARQELTGKDGAPLQLQPVAMSDHPLQHVPPKELSAGYRELADLLEAQDEPEPDGA